MGSCDADDDDADDLMKKVRYDWTDDAWSW